MVGSAPNLSTSTKTVNAATAVPGALLTYTLTLHNSGTAPATGAHLTDTLPANVTFVSADTGGTLANGVVTWNLGTKNPGDTGTVHPVARIIPDSKPSRRMVLLFISTGYPEGAQILSGRDLIGVCRLVGGKTI